MKKGSGTFFVYRKFCGRTTRNGKRAKAGYHYDSGILPFAIFNSVWYTRPSSTNRNLTKECDCMKKKLSVIAVIILVLAICVSAWFYG